MTQLRVTVPVTETARPDDPDVLALVDATIARQATAWTAPAYDSETTSDTGTRLFVYLTDAQPRGITTTANVAPALLPPKVP